MALKQIVAQKILTDVIRECRKKGEWKVLVVDQFTMQLLSACFKMHEIVSEGITLIEDIDKIREPLFSIEAIYLVTPSIKSISNLINDFNLVPRYRAAHLFFTSTCTNELAMELAKSNAAKYIKVIREINVAFLPVECRVFSLHHSSASFAQVFNPNKTIVFKSMLLDQIAEQLATVCVTLNEYPHIRYESGSELVNHFARIVQAKLKNYKANLTTLGNGTEKERSQLLIISRGFDCVSPLLHELTFQAMCQDLLLIKNDEYVYDLTKLNLTMNSDENSKSLNVQKHTLLDENDAMWIELRHLHIAQVLERVNQQLKHLVKVRRKINEPTTMNAMIQMLKLTILQQKEIDCCSMHFRLAEECMNRYECYLNKLYKVEQNLVMDVDSNGEKVKNTLQLIVPVLLDENIQTRDKLRIILLYILSQDGITEDHLNKLIKHAQITNPIDKAIITNMTHLGVTIISGQKRKHKKNQRKIWIRKQKLKGDANFLVSSWIPPLKRVIEDVVSDNLKREQYPFLSLKRLDIGASNTIPPLPTSLRFGNLAKIKPNLPRLIVFVLGGVTYSEMRVVYEVTSKTPNYDIYIGSENILTSTTFLESLRQL